jgi:putative membrane protein
LALVLTAAAMPAFAQSTMATMSPDIQFAHRAAQGGAAEVAMAQLALQTSQNPTVRAFAHRMIADHTPNNAKLAAIMKAQGIPAPAQLDANSRAAMAKLQGLSGHAFNLAYMHGQVSAHESMQVLMQTEINGGKNPALVAFAKATLPTVNAHLTSAKSVLAGLRHSDAAMGGSADGGTSGASPVPMATPTP